MANFLPSGGDSRRESGFERQAKINAACSSLIQIGFCPDLFTLYNLHNNGFTENEFLKIMEPISSIKNLDDLRYLFNAARESVHCSLSNEFIKFIYYMIWLVNAEQGKKVMADVSSTSISRKKDLEKNREMSKADVALARMLVDYATPRNQKCYRILREIGELKKRQKELETECLSIHGDLKAKLGPIYGYKVLPINELRIEAYKLYEEDCRSKGIVAIPKIHEMGFAKAVEAFGGVVKERQFVKYLNDPIRKEKIENFFKERILRLEYTGGGGYRNFVVADSGEALNESVNIVHTFVRDVFEELSDEAQQPDSKRARSVEKPNEEEEHGAGTVEKV